jgi:hypothetical protein
VPSTAIESTGYSVAELSGAGLDSDPDPAFRGPVCAPLMPRNANRNKQMRVIAECLS